MYGKDIGSLTITARKVGDNNGTLVWSKSIEEGNRWEQGEATVPAESSSYQVCGSTVYSTMACVLTNGRSFARSGIVNHFSIISFLLPSEAPVHELHSNMMPFAPHIS